MSTNTAPPQGLAFGNRLYDRLKFLVQLVLPALATLYIALGAAWGLPHVEQVVATITALTVFLGVLLGLSSKNFVPEVNLPDPDGTFEVTQLDNGKRSVQLNLDKDPETFVDNEHIVFKLSSTVPPPVEEDREQNSP